MVQSNMFLVSGWNMEPFVKMWALSFPLSETSQADIRGL